MATATQLARRSGTQQQAPRTRPMGISVAKADKLVRAAKGAGARAAANAARQKALMVSIPAAAAFGALESRLPDYIGLGLPGGKRLVPGLGLAVAGAFVGGSLGQNMMLVGLGPACAGACDFGRSVSNTSAASVEGLEDIAVAGLEDIAVAGDDDRYRDI